MEMPRRWAADELDQAARTALSGFVAKRIEEGSKPYCRAFEQARPRVEALFEVTDDLRTLSAEVLRSDPKLIEAARWLAGPPLSQDDLDTVSGGHVSNRRSIAPVLAARVLRTIQAFLDPFRCPWLESGGKPSRTEVRAAIDWTTSLWAVERCRTARRGEESAGQEEAVAALPVACGLSQASNLRRIQSLDNLDRGLFTREVILGRAKADLAVRLKDGRLLAIECKASNSALNSVKRLNRETVGKAGAWATLYGQQVGTVAVLSGVFVTLQPNEACNANTVFV